LNYGFLINGNLEPIRNQIKKPELKIIPNIGVINAEFPDDYLGISIVKKPKDINSFLIVFKLKTVNGDHNYGVLLPGPSEPGVKIYKNLDRISSSKKIKILIFTWHYFPKRNI